MELVDLHAASESKIGRDAAELCGLEEPTGVIATNDVQALVDLKPDCLVYITQVETRPKAAIEELATFLSAGINVVGASLVSPLTLASCRSAISRSPRCAG